MTAIVGQGKLGGGRIDQKGKQTHGHGQPCGDCRGWGGCYMGLNDNGKHTIKKKKKPGLRKNLSTRKV